MKMTFVYYLHDDNDSLEMRELIEGKTGIKISDELAEKIGRPFYEVALTCELDTETGEVKLLGVR